VRGYLQVVNDICYLKASALRLNAWAPAQDAPTNSAAAADTLADTVNQQGFAEFLQHLNASLSSFDWRTSSTPELDETVRRAKLVFRGSGGYKELRTQLLEHLANTDGDVADPATRLIESA
jgi:hypothetical protein